MTPGVDAVLKRKVIEVLRARKKKHEIKCLSTGETESERVKSVWEG